MKPKQEAERLMNQILPLAERMLKEYGEFYPYGGYMKYDGSIVDVGAADPTTSRPNANDLISILRSSLREIARNRGCKAAAIIFDVTVALPQSRRRSNAIEVRVEHVDVYSADVFLPYELIDGNLQYGETFAQQGKSDIFASRDDDPSTAE